MSRALDRPRGFAIGLVIGFAMPPVAGYVAFGVIHPSIHEHVQAEGPLFCQAWNSAGSLREQLAARDGVFPEPGPEVDRLVESRRQSARHDCTGPLRYERLDAAGTRARLVALGQDGVPGGEGCDRDVVVWMDAGGRDVTYDAREVPAAWQQDPPALLRENPLGSCGIR